MATVSNDIQIRFSKGSKTSGYADVKNLRNADGTPNATGIRVFKNDAKPQTFKSKLSAIMKGLEARYPGEYEMNDQRSDFALIVLNRQSLTADDFINGLTSNDNPDDLPF